MQRADPPATGLVAGGFLIWPHLIASGAAEVVTLHQTTEIVQLVTSFERRQLERQGIDRVERPVRSTFAGRVLVLAGISIASSLFGHRERLLAEEVDFAGRIVLFGPTADGGSGISSLRPDGTNLRTDWSAPDGAVADLGRVSPDGRSLAFGLHTTATTDPDPQIAGWIDAIAIFSDGGVRELGLSGVVGGWSPDSRQLVVTQLGVNDVHQSMLVDVTSAVTELLSLPRHVMVDDWSRDGRSFLLLTRATADRGYTHRRLHVFDRQSRQSTPLHSDETDDDIWGRFSPAEPLVGHYRRTVMGSPPVYEDSAAAFSAIDGSTSSRSAVLTSDEGGRRFTVIRGPCWSPDGEELAWIRMGRSDTAAADEFDLLFVGRSTGRTRRVSLPGIGRISSIDWR